jgi:hypothetical protein
MLKGIEDGGGDERCAFRRAALILRDRCFQVPLAQLDLPSASRLHRAIPHNHGEPATRIRGWNSRRRARTMRRASQTANTSTITRITTGWNAMSKDAPTAMTSSPRRSRMLEKGSSLSEPSR